MRVKAIMMPFSKLACISVENTVEEAMKIIDEQGLLASGSGRTAVCGCFVQTVFV